MSAAYFGIGAAFVAIGGANIARSRKADEEVVARNARLSGGLMMVAGIMFFTAGAIAGR